MFIQPPAFATFMHSKVAGLQTEPIVAIKNYQFLHQICVSVLAIGSQSHDFVFLSKSIKADELTKSRIEKP